MVVVVGALLASVSMGLKPKQKANQTQEKMQNILGSIGVECSREEANENFMKYVTKRLVLSSDGALTSENSGAIDATNLEDAFNVDVKKEFRSIPDAADRNYPLYICEKDGDTYYVIPMVGKGLWGPIWGFVALESDLNTVYGAKFDHKTETPGLGAEINQPFFQDPFVGKNIFDAAGEFASVKVIKGGAGEGNMHGVDAITGGTITSNGVSEMLERTLGTYVPYFKNQKAS